jgi:coenzyme F420-reducing hydrogenase delta subunit/quinol-cytochrome oxidoreductase complex cytochrome b subunit
MSAYRPALRKTVALRALERVEAAFDWPFGPNCNPLRHLGALGFFLFWVIVGSGIYLYVAFDATAEGAYRSTQALSQTAAGALARGLHRYASDAFVLVVSLHLLKEYVARRYTGPRWFAWVTGVALVWLIYASGLVGYWLVWDALAQLSLTATAELLDWLPLFGLRLVRNFLDSGQMTDRFYALLMFLHIGIPLVLLLGMWLHIQRVVAADVHPRRALALGMLATLAVLAVVKPVVSEPQADLSAVPLALKLDWWLLFFHPLTYATSPAVVWTLALGLTALLVGLPWLKRGRREPVAQVSLTNCNGCGRCFADCPFGAVVIEPRTDGRRAPGQVRVLPGLCVACGICAGACPSSTPFRSVAQLVTGIDMPQQPVAAMREELERTLAKLSGEPRIVVFGCERAVDVRAFARRDTVAMSLLCTGQLAPAFIVYALRRGADGVLITGCPGDGCHFRLGNTWTDQRLAGQREPHLRARVPRTRVRTVWTADARALARALDEFRVALRREPRGARPANLPPRRHDAAKKEPSASGCVSASKPVDATPQGAVSEQTAGGRFSPGA